MDDVATHDHDDDDRWSLDVWLVLAARFVRMLAFGSSSLILALYLSSLTHSPVEVGRFLTLTLFGDFILSLVLTFVAESVLGRRNTLRLGAASMLLAGIVFATTTDTRLLLIAAVFGVISPAGSEIGPFRAVEESILAQMVPKQHRPTLFGWYVVTGSVAASLATWLTGWISNRLGADRDQQELMTYYRGVFVVYAALGSVKLLLSLLLSSECEAPTQSRSGGHVSQTRTQYSTHSERAPLLETASNEPANGTGETSQAASTIDASQEDAFGWSRLGALCLLFAIDSLGSGMASQTLTSWFLALKFHADLSSLGTITSAALMIASISNLFSARLANRLGLVVTMVLTHLPSSIALTLTPVPSTLEWTAALVVGRAATASMDQAPRSAFLSAFVPADRRTRVLGLVNTIKTLAQSGGPTLTGWFADRGHMGWAFHLAGALKAGYDLGLLAAFSRVT